MTIYVVENTKTQETLFTSESFELAKLEANKLCEEAKRKIHFRVIRVEVTYITQTLDELMADPVTKEQDRGEPEGGWAHYDEFHPDWGRF